MRRTPHASEVLFEITRSDRLHLATQAAMGWTKQSPLRDPRGERAQAFRAVNGHTPIVCASIELPDAGSRRLAPIAYLVKPFALPDLEAALRGALNGKHAARD